MTDHRRPPSPSPSLAGLRLAYGYESWTTAVHLESALRALLPVEVTGPGQPHADLSGDQRWPMLWVESGVPWVPPATSLATGMSAAYLIDTHRGFRWRASLAGAFDVVFTAQRAAAERLRRAGVAAEWLPLAAPRELCGPGVALGDRAFDVAFVGQARAGSFRAELLTALRKEVSVAPVSGRLSPSEMMDVYRTARIVINVPVADDLNMRVFEAAGARALLVTAPAPGLEAVLDADTFVTVDRHDITAWVAAVRGALRDAGSQTRADAAHRRVLGHHTYDERAATIIDAIARSPRRTISPAARDRALGAAWARWGHAREVARLDHLPVSAKLAYSARAAGWHAATRAARAKRRMSPTP